MLDLYEIGPIWRAKYYLRSDKGEKGTFQKGNFRSEKFKIYVIPIKQHQVTRASVIIKFLKMIEIEMRRNLSPLQRKTVNCEKCGTIISLNL